MHSMLKRRCCSKEVAPSGWTIGCDAGVNPWDTLCLPWRGRQATEKITTTNLLQAKYVSVEPQKRGTPKRDALVVRRLLAGLVVEVFGVKCGDAESDRDGAPP